MKDIRWNGWLTIVWASLVIIVSQILVGNMVVEYHARALGITPDIDHLEPFADALMQSVVLGGLVGVLMVIWIVRLKKGSQIKAYLPFTNSGCRTTFRCCPELEIKSGSRSQLSRSLVRTIPALAMAELVSPAGALGSFRSVQKIP